MIALQLGLMIGFVLVYRLLRWWEWRAGAGPTPIPQTPTSDLRGLKPEDHAWLDAWTYPMIWRIYEEAALEPAPVPAQRALTSTPTWPVRLTKHAMIDACERAGVYVNPTLSMVAVRGLYEDCTVEDRFEQALVDGNNRMAMAVLSDFTVLRERAEEFGHLEHVHELGRREPVATYASYRDADGFLVLIRKNCFKGSR